MATTMSTEAALYRLLTWLSPAYPIGAYSYSHGIEYAVEAGLVTNRATLVEYVTTALEHGGGRSDAGLLVAAWGAARDLDRARLYEIADLASAWRGTAELTLEAETQGRAFLSTTRAAWPQPEIDAFAAHRAGTVALPVAVGVVAAFHDIELPAALTAYLHAFAANLVSAGIRLIPLGQTDGQRALASLEPVVERVTVVAQRTPLEEVTTAAPIIDWCSMRHETQYTRLFRS